MKKGIIQVLLANMVNLFLGIVTSFILPKFLPVTEYGYIKSFQLYITYIGFFHLGYVDGVYLQYGGKTFDTISKVDLSLKLKSFKIFQTCITLIMLVMSIVLKDWVLVCFSLSILPYNLGTFYKFLYQATGEFKKYSIITNIATAISTVGMIVLVVIRNEDSRYYVAMFLLSYILVAIGIDLSQRKVLLKEKGRDLKSDFNIIKSGFVLMLGNFSSTMLTGMDRWCVKLLIPNMNAFAYYSFAVSLQAMIESFVSPVTIVFYNYLCNEKDTEVINRLKRLCLLFGCLLMSLAFPCKWVIICFIEKYTSAIKVLFILFATEVLVILIRGIYVNLYKTNKQQNIYLKKMLVIIVFALLCNLILYAVLQTKEAFAYATLFSTFVWLLYSMIDFSAVRLSKVELTIIITSILWLLFLENYVNVYIGFLAYLFYLLVIIVLYFRKDILYLLGSLKH